MMDWNAFGVVAACAWCGILLAIGVWKIFGRNDQKGKCCQCENFANPNVANCQLGIGTGNIGNTGTIIPSALASLGLLASPRVASTRKGRLRASALKQKPFTTLIFLSFAALATVEAQKQGQLRIENGELRMENGEAQIEMRRGEAVTAILNSQLSTLNSSRPASVTVSDADIDKGYILVEEDDCADAIEIPTNAVTVGNWHLHGASSNFGNHRLNLAPWSFPMGTNGASFSSFWYFVEGKLRPTPRDAAHEICAVGVPMLAMQGASCLWLSEGDDDSRTIIWDNFFLNGDTNAPVTAQVTLWPSGDFATQSNNLRRVYARIDPRDWDGDGLANEIDPAPKSNDGDCFGTGEGWWAANLRAVAATNALPESYYTLAFTATADRTRIHITCDEASDLGDFVILANAGQSCEVPLLKGANYAVRADAPVTDVALGDENAQVVSFSPEDFDIAYPLDCSFARNGNDYSLTVTPTIPGLTLASLSGGCCALNVTTNGFCWTCADTCTCHGHEHALDVVVSWGGYSRLFGWWGYCNCHYTGGGWGATNDLVGLSMTLPKVLFTNNDGGAEPDDIATLSLGFASPTPTNGTLTLDLALPDVDVNVWAYSNRVGAISFPLTWDVEDFTGLDLFVEGRAEDVMEEVNRFTFEWRDAGGTLQLAVTNRFTVYHPVANVVNGTLYDGGELCNPAAIVTGTNACFALEFPTLHPVLNPIQWSVAEGDARFVGGDTGERVRVASDATNQVVTLRAQIGDSVSRPIEMKAYVVEPVSVKTTVWIVRDDSGGNAARSASDVTNIIAEVNRVYAQIGVSFYIDSISYTNCASWLDISDLELAAGYDVERAQTIVNLSDNTGGVELCFINDVGNNALGRSLPGGALVSVSGDFMTVAHELGHAFNLADIYPRMKRNRVRGLLHNEIIQSHLYDDWNNGTGFRYYRNGDTQEDVVRRLLMCGKRNGSRGDLSFGSVYGFRADNAETTVDVGFFTGNIRKLPVHQ